MNFLFFDTETTGLPHRSRPLNFPGQPHMTQLGAILQIGSEDALIIDTLIYPDGWSISPKAVALNGITVEKCKESGIPIGDAINLFMTAAANADFLVCHNADFDGRLLMMEYLRLVPDGKPEAVFEGKDQLCTMLTSTPILKLPKRDKRVGWKWPTLQELHEYCFGEGFDNAHDAYADITATRRCFNWLVHEGFYDEAFAKAGFDRPKVVVE